LPVAFLTILAHCKNEPKLAIMQAASKRVKKDKSLPRIFSEAIPELRKGNIKLQSTTHLEDIGHEDAAVLVSELSLTHDESKELYFCPGAEQEQSFVLKNLGTLDRFTNQNETKVQNLVAACLMDALEYLGLYGELGVETLWSVFAYRPDILVVNHSVHGFVLVVEVKKPGSEVFVSREVGGQVYDYLVGNLATGVSCPFAVLSSYDKMCIAYLNDDDKSRESLERNAKNLGLAVDQDILNKFIVSIDKQKGNSDNGLSTRDESTAASSRQSKPNRGFHFNDNAGDGKIEEDDGEEDDDEEDDDDDDPDYARRICYTQTFGREDARVLTLAIRCGLESVAKSEPRDVPSHGTTAEGSCPVVNATGMCWTNIPKTITFKYDQFPGAQTEKYYLWKDLGRGKNGRVFLGVNSTGKTCAAKFFLIDYGTEHRKEEITQETREAWKAAQLLAKTAEADKEEAYWGQFYGEAFKSQTRVVQLNGLWCLLMPYFDPILDSEREGYLAQIEQHLNIFKSLSLRYSSDDLRWRHFGARNKVVYVFDLGSLEHCDEEIDVAEQINEMRAKIGTE
jgi:hypothetical protein